MAGDTAYLPDFALTPSQLHSALRQTCYDWSLDSDQLVWGTGAAAILGIDDIRAVASGAALEQLLGAHLQGGRREAIIRSGWTVNRVSGAAYYLRYQGLRNGSGDPCWIEERGRWFSDADGQPLRARGLLRVAREHNGDTASGTRCAISQQLATAVEKSFASGRKPGLFFISIDNFRAIVSLHGSGFATMLETRLASAMRSTLHIGDTILSMEEGRFAALLHGCTPAQMAGIAEHFHVIARRLQHSLCPFTLSIGGAHFDPAEDRSSRVFYAARHALATCGRNRQDGFVDATGQSFFSSTGTSGICLAQALDQERIFLAFEPVRHFQGGAGIQYRACPFIREPNAPMPWQPLWLAGDISPCLGRRLNTRLLTLAGHELARHPALKLVMALPSHEAFEHVEADFTRLTVEIDERCVATAQALRTGIRQAGAHLGIYGFGGGHLSYEDVSQAGAASVTLRGCLVDTAEQDAQGRFVLRNLLQGLRTHHISAGAEWVDDETMAGVLEAWGCTHIEGSAAGAMRLDLPRTASRNSRAEAADRKPLVQFHR